MNNDSHEFLVKTNKDVDDWMDSFYVEGHKSEFRLYCQWAWQEQERRLAPINAQLLEALEEFERIRDIWLPAEAEEQHGEELHVLHMARNKMLAAIALAKGEK